jgi:hypothetical protein
MSNSLAIAAVTSSIRYVLQRSLDRPHAGKVGGADVTTLRPADLADDDLVGPAGINVFCYLATANHAWNLNDLPTRRADGGLVNRPVAAVDLHYLVTCYGTDRELVPQRLLGRVVVALKETSVLTRDLVAAAMDLYDDVPETSFLAEADLADEVELVKLAPTTLSLEEMSKLWGVLDTPYLLSLTYLATVVLVSSELMPARALPVRQRALTVAPSGPPRLTTATTEPAGQAVEVGTVVLRGSGLLGPEDTEVRIGPAALAPAAGASGEKLRVTLDATVPAGLHGLLVTHRSRPGPGGLPPARTTATSNALPLTVRPIVTVGPVTAAGITLQLVPPLWEAQRATVVLGRLSGGAPADPSTVTVVLPPVAAADAPLSSVTVPRADVPDGTWLVRVMVDGVDSLPELVGDTYGAPSVTLPPP